MINKLKYLIEIQPGHIILQKKMIMFSLFEVCYREYPKYIINK